MTIKKPQVVDALRKHASINKCFNDVCHLFALRQRSRRNITVHGLKLAMTSAGFDYSRDELKDVLTFLSKQGIGTLQTSRSGMVKGLLDIRMTLQSIGEAAVSKQDQVQFKPNKAPRAKFDTLAKEVEKVHKKTIIEEAPKAQVKVPVRKPAPYPTYLTILVEGKPMTIQGPTNITSENLTDLLVNFRKITPKSDAEL